MPRSDIRGRGQPNQVAIAQLARQLAPREWRLKGEPSLFQAEGYLRVKAFGRPSPEEIRPVSERLEQETGFRLVVSPA